MARTYNAADLTPIDTTNAAWALAAARRMSGDKPNEGDGYPLGSLNDDEWLYYLNLTAYVVYDTDGTTVLATYYRPHHAAANVIGGDPYWSEREEIAGYRQQFRTADDAAAAILKAGTYIDQRIQRAEEAAGREFAGGGTWRIVF